MGIIVTADLHWSDNPRDAARHRIVDWLVDLCKRMKADDKPPEALFILGDLTEAKDEHRAWLANTVVEHIARLRLHCPVVIVRGNHDATNPEWPFFKFVHQIEGVYWVNQPQDSDVGALSLLELDRVIGRHLFLPHTTNHERDWAEFTNFAKYVWIFTHNTFAGADYGHGQEAKGVPPSIFPANSVQVVSGDVHIPQRVGPITYVGAPYHIDFGDDYQPRVAHIQGNKIEFFRIDLPDKRLIEIDDLKQLAKLKVARDDIVKVRVTLSPADHARWPEIQAAVKAWGEKAGVTVNAVVPQMTRPDGDRQSGNKRMVAKRDDPGLVRAYVKNRGADTATEKTGMRLMDQA